MKRELIEKMVCQIVSEHLDIDLGEVQRNATVPFLSYRDQNGDYFCDELDLTELTMAFEEEFGIEVSEEEEKRLSSVAEVATYIHEKLGH